MEHIDPSSPEFKDAVLRDARHDFPEFYARATPEESHVMDGLVLGHVAMTVLLNAPRNDLEAGLLPHLERTSDAVDQLFATIREHVRRLPTFQAISNAER